MVAQQWHRGNVSAASRKCVCAAVDTCETVQSAIRKVMDGDAGSHQHTINNTLSHSGSCAWLLLVLYLLSAFLCPLVITEMDDIGPLIPAAMTLDAPPVAPPVDPRAPLGAMTNTPSDTHESLTPRTFGIVQAATRAAVEMLQANGVAAAAASTTAAAAPPPAAPAPASQVKPPTASKRRTKNSAPQRKLEAKEAKEKQLQQAAQACLAEGKRLQKKVTAGWAVRVAQLPRWPLLGKGDRETIRRRMNQFVEVAGPTGDVANVTLAAPTQGPGDAFLPAEMEEFCAFVRRRSLENNPPARKVMRHYLRRVLNHRDALFKKGEDVQPLNFNAEQILLGECRDGNFSDNRRGVVIERPTTDWFLRFFAGIGKTKGLKEKREVRADRTRANATTYTAAEKHLDDLKHSMMFMPTPVEDPENPGCPKRDAGGNIVTKNCTAEEAILNRETGRFQSGDPAFYKIIADLKTAVSDLNDAVDRELSAAIASVGWTRGSDAARPVFDSSTQASLNQRRSELQSAKEKLEFAEGIDEKRGRERVLGFDEMNQFVNYDGSKGPFRELLATAEGKQALRVQFENRDSMSYAIVHDLTGKFGPIQINLAGKNVTLGMLAPELQDSGIFISISDCGVQTGATLAKYYQAIFDWLEKPREDMFGSYTVAKPCLNIADGHGSRFDPEVKRLCEQHQVRQFLEPGGTSGVLQVLDQVFHLLHGFFCRGMQEMEEAHDHKENAKWAQGKYATADEKKPFKATKYHALQVFGQLHPNGQPVWVSPSRMLEACYYVGLPQHGPDIACIPRERLYDDRPQSCDDPSFVPANPDALLFTSAQNLVALPEAPAEPSKDEEIQFLKDRLAAVERLYLAPQTAAEAGIFIPGMAWHSNAPTQGLTKTVKLDEGDQTANGALLRGNERSMKELEDAAKKAATSKAMLKTWTICASGCDCSPAAGAACAAAKLKLCPTCRRIGTRVCALHRCRDDRMQRMSDAEEAGKSVADVERAAVLAPGALMLAGTECKAILAAHQKAKEEVVVAATAAVVAAPAAAVAMDGSSSAAADSSSSMDESQPEESQPEESQAEEESAPVASGGRVHKRKRQQQQQPPAPAEAAQLQQAALSEYEQGTLAPEAEFSVCEETSRSGRVRRARVWR